MYVEKIFIIALVFLITTCSFSQKRYNIPTQDSAYPVQTLLDSSLQRQHASVFNFNNFNKEKVLQLRNKLKPYVDKGDVYAMYLYAHTYDLFEYGIGNLEDTSTALYYYKMAADHNLAVAEYFLYKAYRYSFMEVQADPQQSLNYLRRTILHADNISKSLAYTALAGIFDSSFGDSTYSFLIHFNQDSCIFYLKKSIELNPKNTRTIDYLGSTYKENKRYDLAMEMYLRSDNPNVRLEVAKWLVEGKVVPQNKEKALQLIYPIAEKVKKEYKNINEYMGGINPIYLLNDLYCKKMITKKQVGIYLIEKWLCDY